MRIEARLGPPARNIPPYVGSVGSLPRPRKLKLASAVIARCRLFGVEKFDDLFKPWSSLSLKNQGCLDKPSCPMLIVNGKEDLQTPIADLYILREYGSLKSVRVSRGGHMGQTPETFPTIVNWLKNELR